MKESMCAQLEQPIPFLPRNIFILFERKKCTHAHVETENQPFYIDSGKGTRKTDRQYDNSNNTPKFQQQQPCRSREAKKNRKSFEFAPHFIQNAVCARFDSEMRSHILFTLSFVLTHFNANPIPNRKYNNWISTGICFLPKNNFLLSDIFLVFVIRVFDAKTYIIRLALGSYIVLHSTFEKRLLSVWMHWFFSFHWVKIRTTVQKYIIFIRDMHSISQWCIDHSIGWLTYLHIHLIYLLELFYPRLRFSLQNTMQSVLCSFFVPVCPVDVMTP